MTNRSLVIDTDTASDDAVALLLAAQTPDIDIRLVTVVAGNVGLAQATRNALITLEMVGAGHVPVHVGQGQPRNRVLETAEFVHGADGLSLWPLPNPKRTPEAEHAVEALLRLAHNEPGQHYLVTLGPFTNIALALEQDPQFLTKFQHTYCMAGAFDGVGNVHRVGEFNVWADPEAATTVVDAAGGKTFIGWDASRRYAILTAAMQQELREIGPLGQFAMGVTGAVAEWAMREYGHLDFDLPDPLAMAAAIDPSLITRSERRHVSIGIDEISRGGSFIDYRKEAPEPNLEVAWQVSPEGFQAMLRAACARASQSNLLQPGWLD